MLKLVKFTPDVECRALITEDDKCYFIQHTEDCSNAEGLVNYLSFLYCNSEASLFTGGVFLLAVWMLFLFAGLATAANSFFCPALQVMAEKMKMSHNVAGVTLLALGNGAPDIFSSLAGIRQGRAALAFGELFGAGIFCTTIIAGSISFIKPFPVMQRPFLRDCAFYLAAVYFVFWVFYHRYVHLGHAIGFIALYIVYVLVVIIGRLLNSRITRNNSRSVVVSDATSNEGPLLIDDFEEPIPSTSSSEPQVGSSINRERLPINGSEQPFADTFHSEAQVSPSDEILLLDSSVLLEAQPASILLSMKEELGDLYCSIRPFSTEEWINMKWFSRILRLLDAPFHIILRLTIPLVSEELPRKGWCRLLACLQISLTPPFMVWALGYGNLLILNFLSVPLMAFIIGVSISLLLAIFTERKTEPKVYWTFAFWAFVIAVVWIDLIANEIMAVLFTFGVVFQLSDAILGLTILAWGNSVGDFAADISMARQNAPRMGFSACFGAPLLNTLLGLGISFTIVCTQLGDSIPVTFTKLSLIMTVFLAISLVTVFVYLPLNGFRATKRLGVLLFGVYILFMVTAILQEANVLWPDL